MKNLQAIERFLKWYLIQKWYNPLEILFDNKSTLYFKSICTFTLTFWIDQIDGNFAQDIEEYCLFRELGRETERLSIFNRRQEVQ